MNKIKKDNVVTVRLNDVQVQALQEIMNSEKVAKKNLSATLQYLVNQYMVFNKK